MKNVVIAGAGDDLGKRLVTELGNKGIAVRAGYIGEVPGDAKGDSFGFDPLNHAGLQEAAKEGGPIDMLVVNIDYRIADDSATILDKMDYDALLMAYEQNTIGALKVIESFLPQLEKGEGKRICVVTSKESSNYSCQDISGFATRMTLAALNMAVTQLFNGLRPKGFTFRLYAKDVENGRDDWAAEYFTRKRSYEPEDLKHSDEERIVMRDWMALEVPF